MAIMIPCFVFWFFVYIVIILSSILEVVWSLLMIYGLFLSLSLSLFELVVTVYDGDFGDFPCFDIVCVCVCMCTRTPII
jgi:hypothetical protein